MLLLMKWDGAARQLHIALALCLFARSAAGQGEPITRVTVNQVRVDVVVTDSNGDAVPDLQSDDFQVFQDGKRQSPIHVQHITQDRQPGFGRAPSLTRSNVARTLLLIIDDANMDIGAFAASRRAIQQYLSKALTPGDLVAVITTSHSSGFFDQFTSDTETLRLAANRLRYEAALSGQGTTLPLLRALGGGIAKLSRMPGRKAIIIFGERMPSNIEVLDTYRRLADSALRASVKIYGISAGGLYAGATTLIPNAQFEVLQASRELPPQARHMLQPTDKGAPALEAPKLDDATGLFFLANETGGLFFENSNAIGNQLRKAWNDQTDYYLVAWNPGANAFAHAKGSLADYHSVKVAVNRSGLQVRASRGFYGSAASGTLDNVPRSPRAAMQEALLSPFQSEQLNLKLNSEFVTEQSRGYLRSFVDIDGKGIVFTPHPDGDRKNCYAINLEFLTLPQPADSKVETLSESQIVSLQVCDESYRKILENGLAVTMMHPLAKPGAYEMRLALRNLSGGVDQAQPSLRTAPRTLMERDDTDAAVGSAHRLVQVPDWQRAPSLFGVRVQSQALAASNLGSAIAPSTGRAETISYRGALDGDAAVRRFHPGETLHYDAEIANITDPAASVRIMHQESGAAGEVYPENATAEGGNVSGDIAVGKALTFGSYILQLTVTGKAPNGKPYTDTKEVDFSIER